MPKQTLFDRIKAFLATPFVLILGVIDVVGGLVLGRDGLLLLGLTLLILYAIFGRILPRFRK